ncbi:hypothetical protein [Amycolatopsis sp. FDAARGOS 1241]|uniref:hypothetical protein n=1 Tax=Amycolatopsis sp. FDAARGOS 1241 TaxID=2778070 RepID=UPI001951BA23|nr:hypothetical protein [Amycolatopsis sp. FDAARGOS 1241]QRP47870.1 hypothetical protein I6J71_08140 [Amycolatopsis sp. FDAARGOS 1241]
MHLTERRAVAAVLLVLTASVLLLAAWQVTSALRLYLDTAFVLLAPGWAVVVHLRLATRALEWITAIAIGISGTLLIAQVMVSTHWWHPTAVFVVVAVVTFFALLWQLITPRAAGAAR